MASGATPSHSGSAWFGGSSRALPQEDDVRHDSRPFPLERIGRQPHRADKIGLRGEGLADGAVLFVERVVRGDECQHAARLKCVNRLREEEVVQR